MKYYYCSICNEPITDKIKLVKKIEKGYAFRLCKTKIERYKTKTYFCRECYNEVVKCIAALRYKAAVEKKQNLV